MPATCARCQECKTLHGRGLCNGCYLVEYRRGDLRNYPLRPLVVAKPSERSATQDHSGRRTWDFTEDYLFVKETYGGDHAAIATRLGISVGALKYRLHLRRKWGQL